MDWYVFKQPLAFILFFICSLAEINRTPFDLPEAETELVSGFCTEYSSMKYAMFFMAEYANMITVCAVTTTLFLGGWHGPLAPRSAAWTGVVRGQSILPDFLLHVDQGDLPRYRYDQLMRLGWKVFLPLTAQYRGHRHLVTLLVVGIDKNSRTRMDT